MNVNFKELLSSVSDALDFVESDIFGLEKNHGKHVAYIAARMGIHAGLSEIEISNLIACGLLHDNALTTFPEGKYTRDEILTSPEMATHCIDGEHNIMKLPFYPQVKNVILYHHEKGDGTGIFGKNWRETPYFSRLIHLADIIDIVFYSKDSPQEDRHNLAREFLEKRKNTVFDLETSYLFSLCLEEGILEHMDSNNAHELIDEGFLDRIENYGYNEIINIGSIFSKIVDYKSSFTRMHSSGIAEKSLQMAKFYNWDEETQAKYYLAGALHDIGKLAVKTSVLEKPGKLTDEEFNHIKNHAQITWQVLHRIHGFEDITEWASNHHERLDGSGYPNGKTAKDLSFKDRLLACIDVYQALRENRPYRPGMTHERAMSIINDEVAKGKLDEKCAQDIDFVLKNS